MAERELVTRRRRTLFERISFRAVPGINGLRRRHHNRIRRNQIGPEPTQPPASSGNRRSLTTLNLLRRQDSSQSQPRDRDLMENLRHRFRFLRSNPGTQLVSPRTRRAAEEYIGSGVSSNSSFVSPRQTASSNSTSTSNASSGITSPRNRLFRSTNGNAAEGFGGAEVHSFLDFDPITAVRIIYGLLITGFIFSLTALHTLYILYLVGGSYFFANWKEETGSIGGEFPWTLIILHATLVVHFVLQGLQFPNRLSIFRKMHVCFSLLDRFDYDVYNDDRTYVVREINSLERSTEWLQNQRISSFIYLNNFLAVMMIIIEKLKKHSIHYDAQKAAESGSGPPSLGVQSTQFFSSVLSADGFDLFPALKYLGDKLRFGVTLDDLGSSDAEQLLVNEYKLVFGMSWWLLMLFIIRFFMSMTWSFYHYVQFRRRISSTGGVLRKGVSERTLEKLKRYEFSKQSLKELYDDLTQCTVCLCDFSEEERLLMLPCSTKHLFHEDCIVMWLKKSRQCPLCMLDISYL